MIKYLFWCIVLVKGETYVADAICIFDLLSRYLLGVRALQHCCPWNLARREYTEHSYNCLGTLLWLCTAAMCWELTQCVTCVQCVTREPHGTDSVCTVCGAGVNVLSVTMVTLDNTSLVTARSSPGNHSASVTERRIGSGAFTLLDPCRLCVGEEVKFLQTPETMLFNLPNNPIRLVVS